MNRYQNIEILTDSVIKPKVRFYATVRYPEIPLSENDIYVLTVVGDRLDLLANQYYNDSTLYWIIGRANNQLSQNSIYLPEGAQIRIPTNIGTIISNFNILKLGAGLGYRPKTATSAVGNVTLYISIPGNSYGTDINDDYLPIIKKGTTFQATDGNTFSLLDDVVLTKENTEIRKSRINNNGPFEYVAKTYGKVISGNEFSTIENIGNFEKFKKVLVGDSNVSFRLFIIWSPRNARGVLS